MCFAIVPRGLEHAVGIIQIRALALDFSIAEWGFALGSMFWSTGLFLEAAALAADFAFTTLGTYRLGGRAATANGRGNGALLKLGASSKAVLRSGLKRDNLARDQFIWGLLADEWRRPAIDHPRFSSSAAEKNIEAAVAEFQARLLNSPRCAQPSPSTGPAPLYPFSSARRVILRQTNRRTFSAASGCSSRPPSEQVDWQQLRGVGSQHMTPDKSDVLYGTLGLLVIKTLEALGPLHGYRIARRIEQISGNQLTLNQGTLYPALLKLEQVGWISSKWGTSESGRRVKIYALTRAGRKQLQQEEAQWQRAAGIVERFLKISENPS